MINIQSVTCNNNTMVGLDVTLPGGKNHADMLLIMCRHGYIMCGYLNMETSVKFDDAAVIISGGDFSALLANPVKAVSPKAEAMGIKVGMTGAEAADILNK